MLFAPVMFLLLAVMFPRRVNPKMFVGHRVVIVASVVDELANVASPVELRAPLNHASPVDVKRDVVALVKLASPVNHDLPETVSWVVDACGKVEADEFEVAVKYGAETLEVAEIEEAVSVPSKYPFPATESFAKGEVVPMPTLPEDASILINSFVPLDCKPPPLLNVK